MSKHVCVFDVNETLLDLSALDPLFARHLGDPGLRQTWFTQVLHWSMVLTLSGQYRDFSEIAKASLSMVANAQGRSLPTSANEEIFNAVLSLPPHADVLPAFERLRAAGVRMAALTNSAQAAVDVQLEEAGLSPYLEQILSVDSVRRFKPDPAVYQYAAQALHVDIGDIRLIAVHDWDVSGALQAGCAAAYVSRSGAVPHPCAALPDMMHGSMGELADAIIHAEG